MNYISATPLRRDRKKRRVVTNRKKARYTMMAVSLLSLVLLVSAPPQIVTVLLALCTLLLFIGTIIGLPICLVIKIRKWLVIRKCGIEEVRSSGCETSSCKQGSAVMPNAPRLKKPFLRVVESIVSISAWAFFLQLMEPFITALVWWQGYTLLEEDVFSIVTIEGTLDMVEFLVYFGIVTFLILISWSKWNDWRYGKLNCQ